MLDAATQAVAQQDVSRGRSNHHPCIRQREWIVLVTYPQAEFWAENNLRQRGYQPYLPRYIARVRDPVLHTLTRFATRPLFSGYIFCRYSPDDPWRPIRYCPGIRAALLGGSGIQYARTGDILALQATEDERRQYHPEKAWRPGTPACVKYGPFQGQEAVVLSVTGARARVAMLMLGGLREVVVDLECLAPRE